MKILLVKNGASMMAVLGLRGRRRDGAGILYCS